MTNETTSATRPITSDVGSDGLRDCFLTPIPEIFQAADLLSRAVDAHVAGDGASAEELIRLADMPIIGEWIDSIWLGSNGPIRAVRKIHGLPPVLPKPERYSPRDAPTDMKMALVARDGHHCRLCGIPLVRAEVRKLLNSHYPEAARWTSTRETDQHRGLQVMWLQYDHVTVHSRGGLTSLDNIVVACPACNYGRDRYMMSEVGLRDPRIHPRSPCWDGATKWIGLEGILPPAKRFNKAAPIGQSNKPQARPGGIVIELVRGQTFDIDLPVTFTIAATPADDVRLTAIMVPLTDGQRAGEGIVAADLPKGAGAMDITIDETQPNIRSTLHLVATRDGTEVALSEAGKITLSLRSEDDVAHARLEDITNRVQVVAELYDREGVKRFRLVDQGFNQTWDEHDATILCGFSLAEILEATYAEWRTDPKPPIVETAPIEPQSAISTPDMMNGATEIPELPRMPCDMLYFSQRDGTSLRTVQIVSRKGDSIWAKAIDGRQVKQFKITGVMQITDTETGEDMLPQLMLAATSP